MSWKQVCWLSIRKQTVQFSYLSDSWNNLRCELRHYDS
uniref:Uncharacterized protein n=1 Tax=Arundo donax TaxID=35708 RepID=A0A0A9BNB2_ARUDO